MGLKRIGFISFLAFGAEAIFATLAFGQGEPPTPPQTGAPTEAPPKEASPAAPMATPQEPPPQGQAATIAPVTAPEPFDPLGSAGARAVGLAPPGTSTSNFMDTRLTWTFGDDDFTHPTG